MKIYTGTGDKGETGLFGGARVSKANVRIEGVGDLDALNASLGVVAVEDREELFVARLRIIQSALFDIGGEIATVPEKVDKLSTAVITESDVRNLEEWIDEADEKLEPLQAFVLPGGGRLAASLHVARTQARRSERTLVALHEATDSGVRDLVLCYVNRVSDLCFTWARLANRVEGIEDVPWRSRTRPQGN